MAKLHALFLLCLIPYCLAQGFGGMQGNDAIWHDEVSDGMEQGGIGDDIASNLPLPLMGSNIGHDSAGTDVRQGGYRDRNIIYSTPEKDHGSGTIYMGGGAAQDGAPQIVYGEVDGEHSGYYLNEDLGKEEEPVDYGEDVDTERQDEGDHGEMQIVRFDVGKKQDEIENYVIDNDEEEENDQSYDDIVEINYTNPDHHWEERESSVPIVDPSERVFSPSSSFHSGAGGAGGGGDGASTAIGEVPEGVKVMQVPKGLKLECNVSSGIDGGNDLALTWYKGNTPLVGEDDRIVLSPSTLEFKTTEDDDVGEYSCRSSESPSSAVRTYTILTISYKKLPKSGTALEDDKLSLTCEAEGNPTPTVTWTKDNMTITEAIDSSRLEMSQSDDKFPANSTITITGVTKDDRGLYSCHVSNYEGMELVTSTYIRVKDIYAALWPFLGIVAEVVVLCLFIFIYEKRRTKNDFEESDTDQGNTKGGRK